MYFAHVLQKDEHEDCVLKMISHFIISSIP